MGTDPSATGEGRWGEPTSWSALQRGDVDYVARRFWDPIHRYLRGHLPRPEEAEDATQEFFLRFLQKSTVERLDPSRGSCRTFMFHLARQFLIAQYRARSRQKRRLVALDPDAVEAAGSDELGPAEEFDRQWFLSLIDRARRAVKAACLGRDNPQAYETFRLFYFGKGGPGAWTQKRIAAELGVPATQVNNYLHRTRKAFAVALREAVQEYCRPEDVDGEMRALAGFLEAHKLRGPPPSTFLVEPSSGER